jgi:NAD(P)-dependent dehydrogenase (short-subunit alcohol dehydrogenase family)
MIDLTAKTAVITGGTDGIGAATALLLRRRGAHVTVIGRSPAKADALVARAAAEPGPGSLRAVVADLGRMATVEATVERLATDVGAIDLLVHCVGILIARTEHTDEGIEKDFAVGYLSRFVFLEAAARHGLLHPGTRMVNVAASGPKVPAWARMEFTDLAEVQARTGMRGHGQAQLANDLLTAQAPGRYGITAVGYGPGAVDTNIRRELPAVARILLKPVLAAVTRTPEQVAAQLAGILADPALTRDEAHFYTGKGPFPVSDFVTDPARGRALLTVSTTLARKALDSHRTGDRPGPG